MVIAVKKESDKFLTKNVVYREVLLHRRCLPPTSNRQPASSLPPSAAVVVSAGEPDDLDYTGIYDGMEEEDEGADNTVRRTLPASVPALPSLSHPLPPNVTLAPLPTAREAEVGEYFGILTFNICRLLLIWRAVLQRTSGIEGEHPPLILILRCSLNKYMKCPVLLSIYLCIA